MDLLPTLLACTPVLFALGMLVLALTAAPALRGSR
jgi:hypothetical protein